MSSLGWPTSTFHVATSLCTPQFAEIPFFRLSIMLSLLTSMLTGVAKRDLNSNSSFSWLFSDFLKACLLGVNMRKSAGTMSNPISASVFSLFQAFHAPKEFHKHTGIHFCCAAAAVWKVLLIFLIFVYSAQSWNLFFPFLSATVFVGIQVSSFNV